MRQFDCADFESQQGGPYARVLQQEDRQVDRIDAVSIVCRGALQGLRDGSAGGSVDLVQPDRIGPNRSGSDPQEITELKGIDMR